MKKTFKELFFEHKSKSTDKWTLYLDEWDRFFSYYREKSINLLEIGVQNGGSLEIWAKYFLNAEKIIGCDIDQKSDQLNFRDSRISVIVGDVNTDISERHIKKLSSGFDIIIDDGSHQSAEVIQSFSRYFPHLKTDGVYIVEDLHTSYWSNFGGGLNNPLSSIAFFKRLADVINFEHWRNNHSRNKVLENFYKELNIKLDITDLAQIHSIEFINSLCVIKKSSPDKNTLGKRIVVGMDEPVAVGMQKYNGSFVNDIKAEVIDDKNLDVFELVASNKTISANYEALSATNEALSATNEVLSASNKALSASNEALSVSNEALSTSNEALSVSNEALTASNKSLLVNNEALKTRNESISVAIDTIKLEQGRLKEYLQQREQILQGLNNKLLEIYGSTAWKIIQLIWKIRLWLAPKGSGREKLAYGLFKILKRIIRKPPVQIPENKDLELIRSSSLFDNAWYLAGNPDVAKSKMDTALHFLTKGGFEGLDPSPLFSTSYYLNQYEDVKISGMNPLLHYLRYGKYEMRRILPSDSEGQLGQASKTTKRTVPDHLISPAIFLKQLRSMKKSDQYAISVSHDNYLGIDAGVQLCIADQQQAFNHILKGYLHIYPYEDHDTAADESFYVGISFDGKELGIMKFKDLLHGIKQINTMKITDIHIHHLKGINIKFVNELLALDDHHGIFWVHDQYSICPSAHLMRNDTTFCDAPDINSNACSICKYSMARKQKQGELLELFKTNKFEVIAPSKFALEYWKDKFPYKKVNGKVIPHVILKWTDNKPEQKRNNTLRIAFVGRSFEYKGWKTWMNIVEEFSGKNKYRFFHFSSQPGATGDYEWVPTRVTASNRTAMIDTLRDHNIDIALLWSTTAETFSFTLHEALAAGCFVITNKESGNIQAAIKQQPKRGLVLDNENELIKLLKSNKLKNILKEYHKGGRPQAKFIINNKME